MSEQQQIDLRPYVGAVIGDRYRLVRFLDEGAFGAVFLASHIAYGVELREVAIKIAKRSMTNSEARRAFNDALSMTRVADMSPDAAMREHFVTVHDAGRCPDDGPLPGHPYVVMELVRGGSLKSGLRNGPFPLTQAVAYFDQILTAMAFMHRPPLLGGELRNGMAHRDLKPGNILVTRRTDSPDLLKVTDFGLAIEVDSLLGWVESGGDLAYLAPESLSHNICSPQSDVYMLGLVFYEMLTSKQPFSEVGAHLRGDDEAKRAELRLLHLAARHSERFPLLESHEEMRPAMAAVIRTALQADMTARTYTTAGELLDAWENAKRLVPPSPNETAWQRVRRLTGEAEQCFKVGDFERGDDLLRQAMEINRDKTRVSDQMTVGISYLLTVERLVTTGKQVEAGKLAVEGYGRRRCRSTCRAMARYFASEQSPLAGRFQEEADSCSDRE